MSTFQQYRCPLNIGLSAICWTHRKKPFTIQFNNKLSRSCQNFMFLRLLVAEIIGVSQAHPMQNRVKELDEYFKKVEKRELPISNRISHK